jgi:predicted neutral ceramidase superfamily lipid hydrolase
MLKLKKEYEGLIVSRVNPMIGNVTFDTNKVDPSKYENYAKIGFEHMFEEVVDAVVDAVIEIAKDKIEDITEKIIERRNVRGKRKALKK